MLPRRGDHYLNQMYIHDISLKEDLKQKMLSQECIFKKQVNRYIYFIVGATSRSNS